MIRVFILVYSALWALDLGVLKIFKLNLLNFILLLEIQRRKFGILKYLI